jgi:hypothetical protein
VRLEFGKLPVKIIIDQRLARDHDNLPVAVNLNPANLQSGSSRRLNGKPQISLAERTGGAGHGNNLWKSASTRK